MAINTPSLSMLYSDEGYVVRWEYHIEEYDGFVRKNKNKRWVLQSFIESLNHSTYGTSVLPYLSTVHRKQAIGFFLFIQKRFIMEKLIGLDK